MKYQFETSLLYELNNEDRAVTKLNALLEKRNMIIDFFNNAKDKERLEWLHGEYDEKLSDIEEDIERYQRKVSIIRSKIKMYFE